MYEKSYHTINYYNATGTDIAAGQIVVVGSIPMVAVHFIASAAYGVLTFLGEANLDKDASVITQGDAIYWDDNGSSISGTGSAGCATTTASGNELIGFAAADAATGIDRVKVQMTAARRTTTIAGVVTADSVTGTSSTLPVQGLGAAQGGTASLVGGTSSTSANAGGAVAVTGGAPGLTGAGGAVAVAGGAGGATSGTGGAASLRGGAGTGTSASGGAVTVAGGAGVSTAGVGGAVAITGGASPGASGTAGAVTVDAGAATGGTGAAVNLGTANATAVNIGKASVPTNIVGPVTLPVGASTAALGTTYANAAGLPAGTASIYPVTAADDAVGVIIDAADKVTGRTLFIGNLVSNKVLKVYGPSGATINGAGANAAFSSASGKGVIITCLSGSGNTWMAW
jgi:hypothetical protein